MIGMVKKRALLNEEQKRLHDGLEKHPILLKRFQSILDLAQESGEDGRPRSADEVESLLIDQIRKLGKETLESWAQRVERQVSEQHKATLPGMQQREKKR